MCPDPLWGNDATRTCDSTCAQTNQFGDSADRRCKPCDSNCKTCQGTATICTSCETSYFLHEASSVCYQACPAPTWGDSNTGKCETTCTKMNEYGIPNEFGDESDNRLCKPCDSSCLTCSETPTCCTSCAANLFLSGSVCVSSCPPPFWGQSGTCQLSCENSIEFVDQLNNRICKPCEACCKSCLLTTTACTSCEAPLFLSGSDCVDVCPSPLWGILATQTCSSSCPGSNEFGDELDKRICKQCDGCCETCSGTPTSCLSCSPPFYLSGSECLETCPSPLWGNNGTRRCASNCENTNEFGDAADRRICKTCSSTCVKCSGAADICTQCPINKFLYFKKMPAGDVFENCIETIYLNRPHPLYDNLYFYLTSSGIDVNSGLAVGSPCFSPCRTCSGFDTCLTCVSGFYLYQNKSCVKCDQIGSQIKGIIFFYYDDKLT